MEINDQPPHFCPLHEPKGLTAQMPSVTACLAKATRSMRSKLKRNPRSLGVSVAWEENRRATRQTGITIAPSAFTDPDMLKELMLALASPGEPPCSVNSSTKGGNACSGPETSRLKVQNFSLPVGPGHQRGVPATWLSEIGLHVPQGLRRGQSNPDVNRRGLSETLEVGLRKPPVRRLVLVEPPSPFPPSLLLIHFSGGFHLFFSSTLESQIDLLSDFYPSTTLFTAWIQKPGFSPPSLPKERHPLALPFHHDARSKI